MVVFAVINVIHSRGQLHVDTVRVVAHAGAWSGLKGSFVALIIRPPVARACAQLKQPSSWFESRHVSVVCLEYLKKGDPTIVEMGRMRDGLIKCHYATAAAASLGGRKRRH